MIMRHLRQRVTNTQWFGGRCGLTSNNQTTQDACGANLERIMAVQIQYYIRHKHLCTTTTWETMNDSEHSCHIIYRRLVQHSRNFCILYECNLQQELIAAMLSFQRPNSRWWNCKSVPDLTDIRSSNQCYKLHSFIMNKPNTRIHQVQSAWFSLCWTWNSLPDWLTTSYYWHWSLQRSPQKWTFRESISPLTVHSVNAPWCGINAILQLYLLPRDAL